MRHSVILLLCCIGLIITDVSRAEDWPRFRGPTGQGISTEKNVPVEWSLEKNVAWKTPIPGQGWSSPIVFGERVFLTSATEDGKSAHVMCVNAADGKILWDREVFEQDTKRKEGKNSYATPTPVTDGKRVYAFFGAGGAAAIDFDGNVVWTNTDYPYYSQHGFGSSPVVYNDLLIMPFDGSSEGPDKGVGWQTPWDKAYVVALDTATGKQRWKTMRGMSRISHMTPLLTQLGGKDVLISPAGDAIQGFEPNTGERLWTVYSKGEGVTPSPAIGDGLLFTSSGFGDETIRAIKLDPAARGDLTKTHIAWELKRAVPTQPSLLYHDGLLYSVKENGIALCVDARTADVIWQERLDGSYSASPVFADGRIYYLAENGDTTVIQAGRAFKEVGVNPLEGKCQASPAISNGRIFIRSDKHLFCIK
jgi:outer membrane protein assembly factor BamB